MRRQLRLAHRRGRRSSASKSVSPGERRFERVERGVGLRGFVGGQRAHRGALVGEHPGARPADRPTSSMSTRSRRPRPSQSGHARSALTTCIGMPMHIAQSVARHEGAREHARVADAAGLGRRRAPGFVGVERERRRIERLEDRAPGARGAPGKPHAASSLRGERDGLGKARPDADRVRLPPKSDELDRLHADRDDRLRRASVAAARARGRR